MWLGPADEHTDIAFKMLRNISEIHYSDDDPLEFKQIANEVSQQFQLLGYEAEDWP